MPKAGLEPARSEDKIHVILITYGQEKVTKRRPNVAPDGKSNQKYMYSISYNSNTVSLAFSYAGFGSTDL